MKPRGADVPVYALAALAGLIAALGPMSARAAIALVSVAFLVVAIDALIRDITPDHARIATATTIALLAWPMGHILAWRTLASLALGVSAIAAGHLLRERGHASWLAVGLAGGAHMVDPEIGVVALCTLAATAPLGLPQVAALSALAAARWPWSPLDAAAGAGLVAFFGLVGHLAREPLARGALREPAQRMLLTLAALVPGIAVAVGVVAGGSGPGILAVAAAGGLWVGVAAVGLMTLLATTTAVRPSLIVASIVPIVAAVIFEGLGALAMLIAPGMAAFAIGWAALARELRRHARTRAQRTAAIRGASDR